MNTILLYDIIRYLYQETSPEETQALEKELFEKNNPMVELFYELAQLKSDLNKLKTAPSRRAVKNILEYSKNWQTAS